MTILDRRRFLSTAAAGASAVAGSLAASGRVGAAALMSGEQAPGFYRLRLGEFEITQLSDGFFELPSDSMATNVAAEEREAYFDARLIPLDKFRLQATPLLINTGEKLILVDAGMGLGQDWAPEAGRLAESLAAAGVSPDGIDVVVVTHAHPDHVGGLVELDGELRFPKAEVVLSEVELDTWTAADAAARVPEWARGNLEWTQSILANVGDHLRPIKAGSDVVTGIQSLDTHGHTQGHMSLLLGSGGQELLITGDAVANIHIAFERPDWQIIWDHDGDAGAEMRAQLLDRMATDRLLVAGYHYPFPGIGYVVRDGSAYRWLPDNWHWTL